MAKVKGLKVENEKLQSAVDEYVSKWVTQYQKVGKEVLKQVTKDGMDEWYAKYGKPGHAYSSMHNSVKTKVKSVKENSSTITITFEAYIDETVYSYMTKDYNIYHYRNHDKIKDPLQLTLYAQWNNGIIGLPSPYPHYPLSGSGYGLGKFLSNGVDGYVDRHFRQELETAIGR